MKVNSHRRIVVKFGLSGSFRFRVGVKTSLVDIENETVMTAP